MNTPKIIGKVELPISKKPNCGCCHSCNKEFGMYDIQEPVWLNKEDGKTEKFWLCIFCVDDLENN